MTFDSTPLEGLKEEPPTEQELLRREMKTITKTVDELIPIEARLNEIQAAFTEWDRRYREEPERFENEATHLLWGTPETYGESAAPYFVKILEQVQAGNNDLSGRR